MRKLFSILNLILCFELIVSPMAPSLSFISAAHAEGCGPGLQMDSTLNRCLTTAQTANVLNATANCSPGDKACYLSNAESAMKEKEDKGEMDKAVKNKGFTSTVINAAAVAVPLTMAIWGLKGAKSSCASISYYAMIGGGVSLLVGDLFANMQHKKRIKGIKEDWEKVVKPEDFGETNKDQVKANGTEAQSQAFEMLARTEDSMEKTAKTKATFYAVAMGAFGVATALSVFEGAFPAMAAKSICKDNSPAAETPGTTAPETTVPETVPAVETTIPSNPPPVDSSLEVDPNYIEECGGSCFRRVPLDTKISLIYSKQMRKNFFSELQNLSPSVQNQKFYNLTQARDIAELHSLNNEYISSSSIPSVENHENIQNFSKDIGLDKDKEIFTMLKMVTLKAISELTPIHNAQALTANPTALVTQAGKAGFMSKIKNFMVSPWGRAAIGGVFFVWSMTMHKHAKSQAEASKNRAEQLRKMRDEFKSASGLMTCAPEERNNPSNANCYCYTAEGGRNPNRGSSQVCQKLWAGKSLKPGNYFGNTADRIKGCIGSNREYDETCKCKASKSCMKAGSNFSGMNPGTLSMMSSGLAPTNGIASGTFDSANANSGTLASNALRIMDSAKKMEDKLGAKFKDPKNKIKKNFENAALGVSSGAPSNSLGSSSSMLPSNPKEAARMLNKDLDEASGIQTIGGGDTIAAPSNSPAEENLEFGLTGDQLADQESQIAEVMKENLDYGGNDINQGSKTNIFEVLSNRYQRSGMRRLFDEKGTTTADKPATTEITQ